MDDVLIAQLPPLILRSALRALVSQGRASQAIFVDHVQRRLRASPPSFIPPAELFNHDAPKAPQFLASVRCMFSSKIAAESLPLSYFFTSIAQARLLWASESELETMLIRACGDVVQAMQALKESRPSRTEELQSRLLELQRALLTCDTYSLEKGLSRPFTRARVQVTDAYSWFFPDNALLDIPEYHVRPQISNWVKSRPNAGTMATTLYTPLGTLKIPRLFNGLWQLSSPAWGSATSKQQNAALGRLVEAGLVATDMADHYVRRSIFYQYKTAYNPALYSQGDAELVYGLFRASLPPAVATTVVAATKWCIFRQPEIDISRQFVMEAVQERSRRLGGRIELLQFHWYDLAEVCNKYELKILTYGSLCGGFIAEKWLGVEAPDIYSESLQLTPSQRKYFDMITTWASWSDFQSLLQRLKHIADKHHVDLTNVATRWVLDRPAVAVVIVGTRLGVSEHIESNLKVFSLQLDENDTKSLNNLVLKRAEKTVENTSPLGQQEPINLIISANSDSAVLKDGNIDGGLQNYFKLSLRSTVNQTGVMRWDYGNVQTGTCEETIDGGNHFRYWIQNGSAADSNAVFVAASYELPASSTSRTSREVICLTHEAPSCRLGNHDIVVNGYNFGRDWIVGNITGSTIPTASLTNSSSYSGNTSSNGFSFSTTVQYVSGLLPNTSVGINHNLTVATDGENAVDGFVAVLTVKITATNSSASAAPSATSNSSSNSAAPIMLTSCLPLLLLPLVVLTSYPN
ncbi:hypothetical protein HHX47_DHR7000608 [Lentinula edodes]|nr:hypothetical protein HHX47_DHR7000608 [Lentinula edodes]